MVVLSKCRRWVVSANNAMIQRASLVSGVDRGLRLVSMSSLIDRSGVQSVVLFEHVEVRKHVRFETQKPSESTSKTFEARLGFCDACCLLSTGSSS